MANPFTPNCTITVWDQPPINPGATILAREVPVRQLRPWGPFNGDQEGDTNQGFLFRWIVFSDYVPRVQHDGMLLAPFRFWATIDGDSDPGYYGGLWSQTVQDFATPSYTYMVLAHWPAS